MKVGYKYSIIIFRGPSGIENHQYLTGLTYEALRRAQRRGRAATGGAKKKLKGPRRRIYRECANRHTNIPPNRHTDNAHLTRTNTNARGSGSPQ